MVILKIDGETYLDDKINILILKRENNKVISALRNVHSNDIVDSLGTKLLHLSIKYRNVFLTKFLIQRGVEIDSVNETGESPLIMALKHKHMEQVELLLDGNANLYSVDNSCKTALAMIFQLRHKGKQLEIVKLALMKLAVTYPNEEELAKILIDVGCSLDIVVYLNNSNLMIKMLECGYNVNTKHSNNSNNTAMHVSAMLNYSDIIKVLLQYGADVSIVNKHGHIPLVHAIFHQSKQDPAVMEALMPQNFDWLKSNFENGIGDRLPLFYIFTKGTKETLRLFQTRYKINLSVKDLYGETPLHYLMTNDNEGILEPFRDAKFDIDAQDFRIQTTALHLAALSGTSDSVRFLLDRGANTNSKDLLGQTPLLHIFNAVSNHDIVINTSPKMNNLAECVGLLLLYGADPEVVSKFTFGTVLDWATRFKTNCLIKPVLAHFALLENSSTLMKQDTRDQIYSNNQLKSYYELCMQQLEKTKTIYLHGRVTIYKILTGSEEKIALYTRRQKWSDRLIHIGFQLESYYKKLLKKRLCDAANINNRRNKVALILSETIGLFDPDHLIIDKIVYSLNKCDFKKWIQ